MKKSAVQCFEEIFDDSRAGNIFSTLDQFLSYCQIKYERCKDNTTFTCKFGIYKFQVISIGLKNLSARLQRIMDNIIVNMINIRFYVDDVFVHSTMKVVHIAHSRNVFELLDEHEFRSRLKKCPLTVPSVKLIGYYIYETRIYADQNKIQTIRDAFHPGNRRW